MSGRRRQLTVERSPVIAWNVQTFHGAPYPDMPAAAAISPVVPAASDPYGRCWQNQVDAGSCFPYFGNIYSSSLPPPSSFRVQPSCVTNLGQFWPPTPPPDGCGRYEAGNNFYFCPPPMTPVFTHNEAIPQSIHGSLPRLSHYSHIIETQKEHNIHSSGLKLESPISPKCSLPHMAEACPPVSKYEAQSSIHGSDSGPKKSDSNQSTLCNQVSMNVEKPIQKAHYSACHYMECDGRTHSGDLIRGNDKENIHNSSIYNSYNHDQRATNGKLKQKNCEMSKRDHLNLLHFKNPHFQPNQSMCFDGTPNSMLANNRKEHHTSAQYGMTSSAIDPFAKNASALELNNLHCREELRTRRGTDNAVSISQAVTPMISSVSAIPVSGISVSSTSSSSMMPLDNCSHHSSHVPTSGYNPCSSIPMQIQMFSDSPMPQRKSCCFSPPHAIPRTLFQHPVTEVAKSNLKQNSYMAFGNNYNSSPLKNVYFSHLESENVGKYASKTHKGVVKHLPMNHEKYISNLESPYEDAKLMASTTEKSHSACGGISNSDGTPNNYMNCIVEYPLECQPKCISSLDTFQKSEKRKHEEVMFVLDQRKKSRRVKVKTEKNETADCRFQKAGEYPMLNHEGQNISNALNLSVSRSPKSEPEDNYINQMKDSLNSGDHTSNSVSVSHSVPVNSIVSLDSFSNYHTGPSFNGSEKNISAPCFPISERIGDTNNSNFEFNGAGYSAQPIVRENLVCATQALPREKSKQEAYVKNGTNTSNDFDKTIAISENPSTETGSQVSFHTPSISNNPGDYYMAQNGSEQCEKYFDQYGYSLKPNKVERSESQTLSKANPPLSTAMVVTCGHNTFSGSCDKSSLATNSTVCKNALPAFEVDSNEGHKSLIVNAENGAGLNKENNSSEYSVFDHSTSSQELIAKHIESSISVKSKSLVADDVLPISETKFVNAKICGNEPNFETAHLECASQIHIFPDQSHSPLDGSNLHNENSEQSIDQCNVNKKSSLADVVADAPKVRNGNISLLKELCLNANVSEDKLTKSNPIANYNKILNPVDFNENHGLNLLVQSIEHLENNQNSGEDNLYSETISSVEPFSASVSGLDVLCKLAEQHYISEFHSQTKMEKEKVMDDILSNYPMVKCENMNSKYLSNQAAEENSELAELEMRKRLAELQRKYKEKQKELARLKSKKMFPRSPNKSGKGQTCRKYALLLEATSECPYSSSPVIHTDENNSSLEFSCNSSESLPPETDTKSAEAILELDNKVDTYKTRKISNLNERKPAKQSWNKNSKYSTGEISNVKTTRTSRFTDALNEDGCLTKTKLRNSKVLPISTVLRKKNNSFDVEETGVLKITRQVTKKVNSESSAGIDSSATQISSLRRLRASKVRHQKSLTENIQKGKVVKSDGEHRSSGLNLPLRSPKRLKTISGDFMETSYGNKASLETNCSRPVSNKRKADNPRKYSPLKQENVTETLVTKQLRNRILINEELSGPSEDQQDGTNGISEELFDAFRKCHLSEDPNCSSAICRTTKSAFGGEVVDPKLSDSCSEPELSMLKPIHLLEKQRVIAMDDGLFYAGHIKVIQPPDVYGIVLDGERGTKPHVFSREEIMKAAMLEVKPKSVNELPERTRVCAYWSQQYRCLYAGSVAKATKTKVESSEPWVFVEFDDGDSGQIPIKNVRLLPPDLNLSFEAEEETKDISSEQMNCESSSTKVTSNRKRRTQREKSKIHQKHKSNKKELTLSAGRASSEIYNSNEELNNSEGNTVSSHTSDSQSTENDAELMHTNTSDVEGKLPQKSIKKMSKRKGSSKAKSKDIAAVLEKGKKHKEKRKHHHHHHHHKHHHHRHHRHCHHHRHCKKHKRRKKGDLNSTISQGNPDVVIPSSSIPDKNLISRPSCHSSERGCNDSTGHSSLELPQQLLEKNFLIDAGENLCDEKCLDAEVCANKPVLRRNHRSVQRSSVKFNRGVA